MNSASNADHDKSLPEEQLLQNSSGFRSGFISIVGRTNVGKSTLLNRILEKKVSIVSDKSQTTRRLIQGILTKSNAQIIFIDTPGFHKAKHSLNKYMMKKAAESVSGVDAVAYVIEPYEKIGPVDSEIIFHLKNSDLPVLLLINKIDLIPKTNLLKIIEKYNNAFQFKEIIPISALKGDNVSRLGESLISTLPPGPLYFPENTITDQSDLFFFSEIIREKALRYTYSELPHCIAVKIQNWKQDENNNVDLINAVIFVEKHSQKVIVVGKGGNKIKQIGSAARQELEFFLGNKVFLKLWVKVRKNWRNDQSWMNIQGITAV